MNPSPEIVRRLCTAIFPDCHVAPQWCERMAALMTEHATELADLVAYCQAMFRFERGLAQRNPAIDAAIGARLDVLPNFGSKLALVLHATGSEQVLDHAVGYYGELRVPVVFALDGRSSEAVRISLKRRGAAYFELRGGNGAMAVKEEVLAATGAEWVLWLDDCMLPTPGLLNFADKAVDCSTTFEWGFARVHCRYEPMAAQLYYSQFLPFGPFASAALEYRLSARGAGKKEYRAAAGDAILLDFGPVVRSFAERLEQLERRSGAADSAAGSLAVLRMPESVPDRWHMFAPLQCERTTEFVRELSQATASRTKRASE